MFDDRCPKMLSRQLARLKLEREELNKAKEHHREDTNTAVRRSSRSGKRQSRAVEKDTEKAQLKDREEAWEEEMHRIQTRDREWFDSLPMYSIISSSSHGKS